MTRDNERTIAVLLGDVHLSHKPPVARSDEPSWYEAMERVWEEIKRLNKPVICAGDVFDRWQSPPELINWAIRTLPPLYSIPGQHDLPYHGVEAVERSAYWTLVEAGVIVPIDTEQPDLRVAGVALWGYPWLASPVQRTPVENRVNVAVIHRYCWIRGKGYPGAEKDSLLRNLIRSYGKMDVLHFGDNHKGFVVSDSSGCTVFNGGSLMRRKTDEVAYTPQVGLLQVDGSVVPYYLDVTEDVISVVDEVVGMQIAPESIEGFAEQLAALNSDRIDFESLLMRAAIQQSDEIHRTMKAILDAVK